MSEIEIIKSVPAPGKQAEHLARLLRKQVARKRRVRIENYRKKAKRNAIAVLVKAQKSKAKNDDELVIMGENIQHPK